MKKTYMFLIFIGTVVSFYYKLYIITLIGAFSWFVLAICIVLMKGPLANNWKKAPKLLNDSNRNYPSLELGYCRTGDIIGLDLTQKYTNLYTDFLLLKRYYSLVRKSGTIAINMKSTKSYMFKKNPSVFSLCMLHPVTLLELGKFYYHYEIKFREILNPLLFLWYETLSHIIKDKKINNINEMMKCEIVDFCKERNLNVIWYINGVKM